MKFFNLFHLKIPFFIIGADQPNLSTLTHLRSLTHSNINQTISFSSHSFRNVRRRRKKRRRRFSLKLDFLFIFQAVVPWKKLKVFIRQTSESLLVCQMPIKLECWPSDYILSHVDWNIVETMHPVDVCFGSPAPKTQAIVGGGDCWNIGLYIERWSSSVPNCQLSGPRVCWSKVSGGVLFYACVLESKSYLGRLW